MSDINFGNLTLSIRTNPQSTLNNNQNNNNSANNFLLNNNNSQVDVDSLIFSSSSIPDSFSNNIDTNNNTNFLLANSIRRQELLNESLSLNSQVSQNGLNQNNFQILG